MISHNHCKFLDGWIEGRFELIDDGPITDDHLDYNTIMDLYHHNSEHIHFFVPLGACHAI
jgi:hypothetical protein